MKMVFYTWTEGWILSKDWCIGCLSIINPSWVVFEHSLIFSSIMCPHSDQLDRSLDWRQLAVPFLEWQVSSDESSSELVRCCSFLTFIRFLLLLLDCLCWW
ncbi:hypothetical protein SETIT_4G146500v2 [Setaria italica]|uniref:Uncharacterized protein n=1 Tax=Setaria italica TaxID=4555 RepID=A0A368QU87_SETIT|nr:hypothetical protein SETIT_4G146500v2 [Setaria italica]